jgi:enamine deaminase RidA (YjgF/YER057c/UK114 family)
MKMRIVNPPSLSAPVGYAHGVLAEGARGVLFLGGQIGWDREGRLAEDQGHGPFVAQFALALDNLLEIVREAGGSPENIAQLRIYVVDKREYMNSLKVIGEVWRNRMGRHFPAMSLVEVSDLLEEGARLEIDGVAVL